MNVTERPKLERTSREEVVDVGFIARLVLELGSAQRLVTSPDTLGGFSADNNQTNTTSFIIQSR